VYDKSLDPYELNIQSHKKTCREGLIVLPYFQIQIRIKSFVVTAASTWACVEFESSLTVVAVEIAVA
jgi:hypothetical protein